MTPPTSSMLVLYIVAILIITTTTHNDVSSRRFTCHGFVLVRRKLADRQSLVAMTMTKSESSSAAVTTTDQSSASAGKTNKITTSLKTTSTTFKKTIEFPSYLELMNVQPGECIVSEPFVVETENQLGEEDSSSSPKSSSSPIFRVKLYPRGTAGRDNGSSINTSIINNKSGFGMAYKILPLINVTNKNNKNNEKLGLYLQYMPSSMDSGGGSVMEKNFVDATFALRLKGQQRSSSGSANLQIRRFDVEWRAAMRFVPLEESNLAQGCANDFGASLMQTVLLKEFLGIDDQSIDDPSPLLAEVEIKLHDVEAEAHQQQWKSLSSEISLPNNAASEDARRRKSFFGSMGADIRYIDESNPNIHDGEMVRAGKTIVPILSRLSERQRMFEIGAYPGVEFRILRIIGDDGHERFTSCPNATYELKPIYPLVSQLERPWPVTVNEREIPRIYTPGMYNIVSAVGSLATAMTGLAAAFIVSQAVSFFFIPSKSMDPTLQVGDVLLVDKISPRLFRQRQKVDDIILFSPPSKLQDIVAKNGGRLSNRDLFVKRIAASKGDKVSVEADGQVIMNGQNVVKGRRDLCEEEPNRLIEKYIEPFSEEVIGSKEVFVMGDCSSGEFIPKLTYR